MRLILVASAFGITTQLRKQQNLAGKVEFFVAKLTLHIKCAILNILNHGEISKMKIIKDIYYSEIKDEMHKITLYLPEGECRALLVYFHGGGFVEGNRDLAPMGSFAEDVTSAGIAVASAEYRMYPEAKYPDFIEDAAEAVAYTKRELLPLAKCERLIVCGTSAGGYLTMMLCFDEEWLGRHGLDASDVDAFIHDAGQPTTHFNVLKERGEDPASVVIDEAAPIYHVKRRDYPPMQFIVSDNDIPGRLEQTEMLIDKLRKCGHKEDKLDYIITHGTHVWYVTGVDASGKNEFGKLILPFINKIV